MSFIYILFFWKPLVLSTWALAFKRRLLCVAFTFLKTESGRMSKWVRKFSYIYKQNEASKKIDPYCCAIKALISGKLETVGHIPREVLRHVFFSLGESGGRVNDSVLSTRYCPSPKPSGKLKISLMMAFRSLRDNIHQKTKNFMTELNCYKFIVW